MNLIPSSLPLFSGLRMARVAGALLAVLLMAAGVAALEEPKEPKKPLMPAGDCQQECFDKYADNASRCSSIWCTEFLFLTLWCDEPNLAACLQNAQQTFEACMDECNEVQA